LSIASDNRAWALSKGTWNVEHLDSRIVERVQLSDIFYPLEGPLFFTGPVLRNSQEIPAHMGPAECKQYPPLLEQHLIRAVAVDNEDSYSLFAKMILWASPLTGIDPHLLMRIDPPELRSGFDPSLIF